MSFCALCRVKNTEEHQADGWHRFNVECQSKGRTPMSRELYERFEKDRFEGGESNVQESAKAGTDVFGQNVSGIDEDKRNVLKWHWEEEDCTSWALKRLTELIKVPHVSEGEVLTVKVTKVTLKGESFILYRKGKRRQGFEYEAELDWEGTLGELTSQGSALCAELSADQVRDDEEVEVHSVKFKKSKGGKKKDKDESKDDNTPEEKFDTDAHHQLKRAVTKALPGMLRTAIDTLDSELKEWKAN